MCILFSLSKEKKNNIFYGIRELEFSLLEFISEKDLLLHYIPINHSTHEISKNTSRIWKNREIKIHLQDKSSLTLNKQIQQILTQHKITKLHISVPHLFLRLSNYLNITLPSNTTSLKLFIQSSENHWTQSILAFRVFENLTPSLLQHITHLELGWISTQPFLLDGLSCLTELKHLIIHFSVSLNPILDYFSLIFSSWNRSTSPFYFPKLESLKLINEEQKKQEEKEEEKTSLHLDAIPFIYILKLLENRPHFHKISLSPCLLPNTLPSFSSSFKQIQSLEFKEIELASTSILFQFSFFTELIELNLEFKKEDQIVLKWENFFGLKKLERLKIKNAQVENNNNNLHSFVIRESCNLQFLSLSSLSTKDKTFLIEHRNEHNLLELLLLSSSLKKEISIYTRKETPSYLSPFIITVLEEEEEEEDCSSAFLLKESK